MGAGGGRCWPEGSVARVPWTQPPGDIDNRREKGALTGTHCGYRTATLAAAAPAPAAPPPSPAAAADPVFLPPFPLPTSPPPPPSGPGQRAEAPPAGNVNEEPPAEPQRGRCRFDGTGPLGRIVRPPPPPPER